jgi:hypothetical protein
VSISWTSAANSGAQDYTLIAGNLTRPQQP